MIQNLSVAEFAKLTGYSQQRIRQKINKTEIRAFRIGGGRWLIPKEELSRLSNSAPEKPKRQLTERELRELSQNID